jgi:hypothetical protein
VLFSNIAVKIDSKGGRGRSEGPMDVVKVAFGFKELIAEECRTEVIRRRGASEQEAETVSLISRRNCRNEESKLKGKQLFGLLCFRRCSGIGYGRLRTFEEWITSVLENKLRK